MNRFILPALAALALAAPAAAGQQDFVLINDTGYTVNEVYVAPSSSDDWEEDVMGKDVLNHGDRTKIEFERDAKACLWDLKVVYSDGESAEWAGFNLCEVSVIAIKYDRRTGETSAEYE